MIADHAQPRNEAELVEFIRNAHTTGEAFGVTGGGTRGVAERVAAPARLSVLGLNGITYYEPKELVMSARAGTPLSDINAALAQHRQVLPFEPYGLPQEKSTIGGVVAANVAGSRRISAGTVRDHLLGVKFVNGRGEVIKSGGRVMKNVTGLDLTRIMCGAYGTLGILTEVSFKLLPQAPQSVTLIWHGLDDDRALELMIAARRTPYEVVSAAHVPANGTKPARTLLRLDGFETAIRERVRKLKEVLEEFASPQQTETDFSLWTAIASGALNASAAHLWRVTVRPSRTKELLNAVPESGAYYFDCAGSAIYLETEDGAAGGGLNTLAGKLGGHAQLVRSTDSRLRPVFAPGAEVLALIRRVKQSLDPEGLFNPGILYADI